MRSAAWPVWLPLAFLAAPQDPAPPAKVEKEWAVRFELQLREVRNNASVPAPLTHLSVLTAASSEGEAAVKALIHLQSFIVAGVQDQLRFYDAQEKVKQK